MANGNPAAEPCVGMSTVKAQNLKCPYKRDSCDYV